MPSFKVLALLFLLNISIQICFSQTLRKYNIPENSTSISGLSSGAYFATQFELAYPKYIIGSGSIAGGPWGCAENSLTRALTACMATPALVDVSRLVLLAKRYEKESKIDSLDLIKQHKVYILAGLADTTVKAELSQKLKEFYDELGVINVTLVMNPLAEHAMLTNDFGNACGIGGKPWIANCQYDAAGELLKLHFGELKPPVRPISSNLKTFSQSPYTNYLGSTGYIYVPQSCEAMKSCRLHIAFHGCRQYMGSIGDIYAANAGYNKWAESNDIIVLYPQTTPSLLPSNPMGCFDWVGFYTSDAYSKDAPQLIGVKKMLVTLTGRE